MAILTACPHCNQSIQVAERFSNPIEQMKCPGCSKSFALHEALDKKAESLPEAMPMNESAAPPDAPAPESGPSLAPAEGVHPGSLAFASLTPDGDDGSDRQVSRDAQRRRRQGPSVLGQMIGVVGGGVLGLTAGYWCLNYFGGERFNFLELELPLIAHTQKKDDPEPADGLEPPEVSPGSTPIDPVDVAVRDPDTGPNTTVNPSTVTDPNENTLPPPPAIPADFVGVLSPITYTSDYLGVVLKDAYDTSNRGTRPINTELYAKLCTLAEVATHVDRENSNSTILNRLSAVKDLARAIGRDPNQVVVVSQLAEQRLNSSARDNAGVVVAGKVAGVERLEKLVALEVSPAGGGESIIVLSTTQAGMTPGKTVVILGTVVDDAPKQVYGYDGSQKQVVWSGIPVVVR